MKQQTAIEWLQYQYDNCPESFLLDEDFEKAKAMEKEQHKETWFDSTKQFDNAAEMTYKKEFEQYYNETFKK